MVEDDSEMRILLTGELESKGYRVTQAGDGIAAAAELSGGVFDLVITDLKMPRMGGLELLPLIKTKWPDLPVLLITAFGDALTLGEAYRSGAAGFIAKPFGAKDVLNAVGKILLGKGGRSS